MADHERAVDHLGKDPRVRLVYLYGLAARAGEARVRDIDLAILTDPALSFEELMRLRADLVQAAQSGLDLVSLNVAARRPRARGRRWRSLPVRESARS